MLVVHSIATYLSPRTLDPIFFNKLNGNHVTFSAAFFYEARARNLFLGVWNVRLRFGVKYKLQITLIKQTNKQRKSFRQNRTISLVLYAERINWACFSKLLDAL